MVQALVEISRKLASIAMLGCIFVLGSLAQQDPPSRVARLNYISGNVSMESAGAGDWALAEINHPFTVGDYLYTDAGARSELHLDIAAIRMGPQTSFGFLNLNDQMVQIKLSEGDLYFRLHRFGPDQVFEVDTPNAAVQLLRDGVYRFRVDPNGAMSFVVVREGQAEVTGGGQAFTINPNNSVMVAGADQPAFDVELAPAPDNFDNWCAGRDAREEQAASRRYLPPTVIGYEDLDQYGAWQEEGEYGPVWYPREVAVGWAPYHDGHWAWIAPWGWTWVDAAPWGFAPFHYGRWAYIGNRWGWCPGPIAVVGYHAPAIRPYYAPALVAWFGGAHWGVSISSGPSLGWVPLGFGEVYTPSYACSRHYFSNVNVYNTRVVKNINITNVYNTVYVNKTVYNQQFINVRAPNAVYAMRQSAFASGQPVHGAGFAVREADVRQTGGSALVASPGVSPGQGALLANAGRPATRPAPQIINRQVIAVHAPAAAPAAFAARHQAAADRTPVTTAARLVKPMQPVQVQAGQRFGRPEAFRQQNNTLLPRQVAAPAQPATPTPPVQPAHGVPPSPREASSSEANRNEHLREQYRAQQNLNRPSAERVQPQPVQPTHKPPMMEHPEGPRPASRPAPEQQHNQPSAPHTQPAPPPANHNEQHNRPAEHNNEHSDHKSQ